jgi:signal transduction histidine kinase
LTGGVSPIPAGVVEPDDSTMTLDPVARRPGDIPSNVEQSMPTASAEHNQWRRRRLLQRQLHDGAALRISALTLQFGLFRHRVPATEPDLRESVDELQDELHAVLQDLRDVARKIYPPLLDQAGLGPALREMAYRVPVTVRVDAPEIRFGPAVEGAAYFAVTECLDALDGGSPPVEVLLRRDGDVLLVTVTGVDVRHARMMNDHVRRMGGTVATTGGPGIGTIIARIPCE